MKVSGIPYVQGRNSYSDADGTKYGIAIHNTSNDASDTAEASFATRRTDGVSSHLYVDGDSVTQSLDTTARAGHAGSRVGNENAVAVEIRGVNGWTRQQWLDGVAWTALGRALAQVCRAYGIAVRRASVAEMQANPKVKAFYGHDDMRRAWGGTTHTDPGPNFPWDHLFAAVNAGLGAAPLPSPSPGGPVELTTTFLPGSVKAGNVNEALTRTWQNSEKTADGTTPAQTALLAKLDLILARPVGGGTVTLSPEQYADLKAALRADQDAYFMTKSGQVAQAAAEAAVRTVLGSLDGAVPPPPQIP